MEIIKGTLNLTELKKMAEELFGDMVKAAVDIEKQALAVNAELHSDLEALLLEKGSKQGDIWGINLYPGLDEEGFIEYDSLINMKPSQGNSSRGVDSAEIRKKISYIVKLKIKR